MTGSADRTLVRELAERIVIAVAPDEIEMFPALADVYETEPESLRPRRDHRDEPLGFGIDDVSALMTPAAFFVAAQVATYVSQRFLDRLVKRGKPSLARLFRRRRKKEPEPAGVTVALTPEQAAEVRGFAIEKAREAGLPDADARVAAEAVVSALIHDSDTTKP